MTIPVPDEAMTAASEAFAQVYNDPVTMGACIRAAVEAAYPLITAAERDRIALALHGAESWDDIRALGKSLTGEDTADGQA